MAEKKRKIPHTYVIVFFIIIIAAFLTWVVPGGTYERTAKNDVIPGSFKTIESEPQTWQIFSSFFDGFVQRADIVIFILVIGGAFWVMNDSKAIDIGIQSFLATTKAFSHNKVLKRD